MRTVVLIPTYNERENVRLIIPEVFAVLPDTTVVVIDDNSPDGTRGVVRALMAEYPNLKLLERSKKEGLGAAYKHAIGEVRTWTDVDAIITMDADGSHDAHHLPELVAVLNDHDLSVGSRYVRGGGIENWEKWRYLLSRWGNLYSRALTMIGINDLTAGFVAVRRELLDKIDLAALGSAGYAYQIEFKFHCVYDRGARAVEVPIVFKSRREGESKISHHIIREGLKTPVRLFWRRIRG